MTNRSHHIILRIESPIYDSSSLNLESGFWGRSWYMKYIFIRLLPTGEICLRLLILRSIMIYEINFHKAVTHWRNFPKAVDSEVYHNIWKKYFIRLLFSRERKEWSVLVWSLVWICLISKKTVVLLTDMKRFDSYIEDSQYWVEDMID